MWGVFSLLDPHNNDKKWYIFLHRSIFSLDYVKHHVKILQKGSKADKYMVQNLTCSGVYLRSNFSSAFLQKVLKLVPLTEAGTKVFVATMTKVIYHSYYYLMYTMNHMKILKLKDHPGYNVADYCNAVLVDVERLESAGVFNPEHLGCIIRIFEYTSGYIFRLWENQKYNKIVEFIKKLFFYDEDIMRPDYIIICGSLV